MMQISTDIQEVCDTLVASRDCPQTARTKNAPKISVIVPVYKVEKYLSECIESILAQTFTDFELILVDDGSPDNSGKICDDYASRDSRIRVFHKENGGVSSARNFGLDNALGEWVSFVDGDDLLCPSMLLFLYKKSCEHNLCDIVWCDYWQETRFAINYVSSARGSVDKLGVITALLSEKVWGVCWNKLVRTHFLRVNDISFPEGISMKEDLIFCLKIFLKARQWGYVSHALYFYRFRHGSACSKSTVSGVACANAKLILKEVYSSFEKSNLEVQDLLTDFEIRQRVGVARSVALSPSEKIVDGGRVPLSEFPFRSRVILFIASCFWGNWFFKSYGLLTRIRLCLRSVISLIEKLKRGGKVICLLQLNSLSLWGICRLK